MRFLFRVLLATLAITVAQFAAGAGAVAIFGASALPPAVAGTMPWQLAANLATAAVLLWLASRSMFTGWKAAAALGVVYFGIMHFNSLIEALFFRFLAPAQFAVLIALTLIMAAGTAALLTPLLAGETRATTVNWAPRISFASVALGALSYLIIYFAAGLSVYPFIRHFYDLQTTPPGLQVIGMQLLVRGPIFVGLASIVIVMSRAARNETTLRVAAALSVLGGVAPLLVPNALMPDSIRWYHFIEVTTSNFVFGAIVGRILTRPRDHTAEATFAPPSQAIADSTS